MRSIYGRLSLLAGGVGCLVGLTAMPVRADQEAEALLKEVAAANKAAQTLTADVVMNMTGQGQNMQITGKVKLKKPNLARVEFGKPFEQTVVSDGKTLWRVMKSSNQYLKEKADPQGANIDGLWAAPITMFFNPKNIGISSLVGTKTRLLAPETIGGKSYKVIEVASEKPIPYTSKLYVGANKLVHRVAMDIKQGTMTSHYIAVLNNLQVGMPLAKTAFAYAPPRTAKLFQPPSNDSYEAKLVAIGKDAPNFTIPSPSGGQVALGEALRGKKALLLNFWFYG